MSGQFLDLVDLMPIDGPGNRWMVVTTFRYQSEVTTVGTVTVPAQFVTDLASVPEWLPIAYTVLTRYCRKSAVVHDYLYRATHFPRADADAVLYEAALAEEAPRWVAWVVWVGVRIGGRGSVVRRLVERFT